MRRSMSASISWMRVRGELALRVDELDGGGAVGREQLQQYATETSK